MTAVSAFPYGVVAASAPTGPGAVLFGQAPQHTQDSTNNPTYAGCTINSNGAEYAYSSSGASSGHVLDTWLLAGVAGDYWVRCTVNSGTLNGGSAATGVWLQLSTTRFWYVTDSTLLGGPVTASITLEIAEDSGGSSIIATENYDISANRSS